MKLIAALGSPYSRKVRIVLAEKKIEYELIIDSPGDPATKVPQYNPLGKIPVLVLEDDTTLFDSRVIVEYLDNASPVARLIPDDTRARIQVRRWEALADGVLDAGVLVRRERARKKKEQSADWIERQLKKVDAGIKLMSRELGENAWCAGTAYTLADIAVGSCLGWLTFRFPENTWRDTYPNLAKLMAKLEERPSFQDTVPKG